MRRSPAAPFALPTRAVGVARSRGLAAALATARRCAALAAAARRRRARAQALTSARPLAGYPALLAHDRRSAAAAVDPRPEPRSADARRRPRRFARPRRRAREWRYGSAPISRARRRARRQRVGSRLRRRGPPGRARRGRRDHRRARLRPRHRLSERARASRIATSRAPASCQRVPARGAPLRITSRCGTASSAASARASSSSRPREQSGSLITARLRARAGPRGHGRARPRPLRAAIAAGTPCSGTAPPRRIARPTSSRSSDCGVRRAAQEGPDAGGSQPTARPIRIAAHATMLGEPTCDARWTLLTGSGRNPGGFTGRLLDLELSGLFAATPLVGSCRPNVSGNVKVRTLWQNHSSSSSRRRRPRRSPGSWATSTASRPAWATSATCPNRQRNPRSKSRTKTWGRIGVDVDDDFKPYYVVPAERRRRHGSRPPSRTPPKSCSRPTPTAKASRSAGTCARC